MKKSHRVVIVIAVVALAALLSACPGGAPPPPTVEPTCLDSRTGLTGAGDLQIVVDCPGPLGCDAVTGRVRCDVSAPQLGDACADPFALWCPADARDVLARCEGGRWVPWIACSTACGTHPVRCD